MSEMFCFQCQQTAGGSGCVKTGVCGKQPETAHLQDALVCRLIRLAEVCQARQEYPPEVTRLLADGLFTTLTNVNFDNEAIRAFTDRVDEALRRHGGSSGSGDTTWLWRGETDTVSLRATLLFGLKGMAAYAHHALRLGYRDKHVDEWFYKGLAALAPGVQRGGMAGPHHGVRTGEFPVHGAAGSGQHRKLRRSRAHAGEH